MPTFEFTSPEGKTYEVAGPDGATREQAFGILQQQIESGSARATEPSLVVQAGRLLNDVPRQAGLTARYAMEGAPQIAEIVTEPVRKLVTDPLRRLAGDNSPSRSLSQEASMWADRIGLPTPQNPLERTVAEGAKMGFGAAGGAAGARALIGRFGETAAPAVEALAAKPSVQIGSGVGAGMAGQASKEGGGGPWTQAGAAFVGGLLGAGSVSGAQAAYGAIKPMLTRTPPTATLDLALENLMQSAGIDYSQLSIPAKQALRAEQARAMALGQNLDPVAASRLADFRTVGATPTRGMLSQDPRQVTNEQNLAKIQANLQSEGGMPALQARNEQALIARLNDLGGRTETDPIAAGRLVAGNVTGTRDALRAVEQGAWTAAKNSPGYKAPISNEPVNAAFRAVDEEALLGFLPKQITDYMAAFQTGQQPFTPQHYQNLRSMLSGELAKGGNEAKAARAAVQALERSQMRPITNPGGIDFGNVPATGGMAAAMRARDAAPGASVDAVDRARRATAAAYRFEDSNPLVRSVLADARSADPERIAQSFILSGTVNDAQQVAQAVGPQGREAIKNALATHIKRQALGGSDEIGKLSQSKLNGAINKIGDEKLSIFFSPEEVRQLRATGRVAGLVQRQPTGSAVNNSNTAGMLVGRGLDALSNTPLIGPFITQGPQRVTASVRQALAERTAPALLTQGERPPGIAPLLLPGLAVTSGLLAQ